MKAYVTAVNEPTLDVCVWSLERNGFDVEVVQNDTLLSIKLAYIYQHASEDFLRIDADIIPNRNLTLEFLKSLDNPDIWWWQFLTFDWYKQDVTHSLAYIKPEAIPALRKNINQFLNDLRPETQVSRIPEFHNPRRMATYDKIMGIHGYGITDLAPVKLLKSKRLQSDQYDFELAERLNDIR